MAQQGTPISIQEALRLRTTRTEYDTVSTGYRGTDLRFEKGRRSEIPVRTIGKLARTAAVYYGRKAYLEGRKQVQTRREQFIKGVADRHPGLRSIDSHVRKSRVGVSPTTAIDWSLPGLRDGLKTAYTGVVGEDIQATVTVPHDMEVAGGPLDAAKVRSALFAGLVALGIPEADVPPLVTVQTSPRVDESKLFSMVEAGTVDPEGMGTATRSWTVKTYMLDA